MTFSFDDPMRDKALEAIRAALNVPHEHSLQITSLCVRPNCGQYRVSAYVRMGGFEGTQLSADKPWVHIAFDVPTKTLDVED